MSSRIQYKRAPGPPDSEAVPTGTTKEQVYKPQRKVGILRVCFLSETWDWVKGASCEREFTVSLHLHAFLKSRNNLWQKNDQETDWLWRVRMVLIFTWKSHMEHFWSGDDLLYLDRSLDYRCMCLLILRQSTLIFSFVCIYSLHSKDEL